MSSSKLENYPWPSTVNAANFISVKLCLNEDDKKRSIKDYKIWKKQMICLLASQDFLGFIDGQIPPPGESMDEQKLWRRTDQLVTGWILGSITGTDVLDAVVGLDSSKEVWLELEKLFKSDDDDDEIQTTSSSSDEEDSGKDFHRYLPLHRAILRGDWKEAKEFLDNDEEAITAIINDSKETALHVAVETGKSNYFLRKLLEYPTLNEAILSKSSSRDTALHVAAMAGNKEAAILLVNKNPNLLYITNEKNMLPIHLAARNSHKDTLKYLISVSKKEVQNSPFVGKLGALLLTISIASEFIDVALYLVQKYPDLATLSDDDNDFALEVIAGMKSVFPSGESFSWWQNWIYSCVPLTSFEMTKITLDIENPRSDDQVTKKFDWFKIITFLVPQAKSMKKKKLMHQQTLALVKCLCSALESLPYSDASPVYGSAIVDAAREGTHEVVEVIVEMFPNAIYVEEKDTECTIFHIAARERVENIFNLIYHMNERKQYFYDSTDSSGNNFMHMCGELAPPHKLNLVSGAALQMQSELQWFKEMENFVNPSRRTWENDGDKTPQTLFSEKHRELKSQGEKWMKDTATSCSIAAALIATVVFAAAFTVPGGLHGETGVPIFVKRSSFILFAISDSVSMFTSATSLLIFLSILTSRYAEQDFLRVLPKRLCLGLLTLFTSITFMVVAFSAAICITLEEKSNLFLIPVAVLACLPVTSFALLQFPLLKDVMYSTYGRGIFGKKSNRTLY